MLPREARHGQRSVRSAARPLTLVAWTLAAVCAALIAAGCGGGGEEADTGAGPSATALEVTLDADGPDGEPPRTEIVSCESTDCSEVDAITAQDFGPTPPDTPCTEIFGGPDTATVEGTLRGEPVAAELTRANGCEIERFDRFTPMLQVLFPGYKPGSSLAP